MRIAIRKYQTFLCLIGILSLIFSVMLISAATSTQKQIPPSSIQGNKSDSEFVCGLLSPNLFFVQVEVTNRLEKFVSNLNYKEFLIYEDRVKQEVATLEEKKVFVAGKERTIYEIGYYPRDERRDGSLRKIRAEVRGHKNRDLKVRFSPKSYLANPPENQ